MPRIKLIRLRRGDAADWTAANPTLAEGEPGFSVDDNELKIGDGSTDWNGLSPIGGGGGAPSGPAGGALDGTYPNPGLAATVAGSGLAESSDVLSVNVDASTIEINADTLRVKADGITANEIAAGAVGASELASTAVSPGTYGDASNVGQFTVDADGRITNAGNVAISGGGGTAMSRSISQTGHGLAVADVVRFNGTNYVKAQADSASNAEVVGIVSVVADVDNFTLHYGGRITGLSGLTAGTVYFLSAATAGLLTSTEPSASTDVSKPLLVADSTTTGYFFNYRGLIGGGASSADPPGISQLVYRYTVTGADKASIDTGVDTADAGTLDWTDGDVLEICIVARTDDAAAAGGVEILFNNDSGANYDVQRVGMNSGTSLSGAAVAQTQIRKSLHGSGGAANYPGMMQAVVPNYMGTTFYKVGQLLSGTNDSTAGSNQTESTTFTWRNTAAITRVKASAVSTAKLKVGSQLLIYKRTSS